MIYITEYYFCNSDSQEIVIPKEGDTFFIGGKVYGHPNFPAGSHIVTSEVLKIDKDFTQTVSGSKYELRDMHPTYKKILDEKKFGCPIIERWRLSGNLRQGYTLTGRVGKNLISGKVVDQNDNYVLIDGTWYYVIWRNWNGMERLKFELLGSYLDLTKEDFSEYMGLNIRPNLLCGK